MSDMKTKRIFVLVFALVLSIASVFTVAAASDDVLIENFQANYSKKRGFANQQQRHRNHDRDV